MKRASWVLGVLGFVVGYLVVSFLQPVGHVRDWLAWRNVSWQEFSSSEGGFQVLFPGAPTYKKAQKETERGPVDVHLFSVRVSKEYGFAVSYGDVPPDSTPIDEQLDAARDGTLRGAGARLLSESKIALDGFPGREVRGDVRGQASVVYRIYQVNQRRYMSMAVVPVRQGSSPEIAKFLDSFQLLDRVTNIPANR